MSVSVLDAAIAEYLSPDQPSLLSIAEKYDIPETSLRREVKRRGLIRGGALARKRRMVHEFFAGETAGGLANDEAAIEAEAEADIADMTDALKVCRKALARLLAVTDGLSDPRHIKAAVDACGQAVATIRKIRGLDEPVDFSDWSDEELTYLSRTGRMPSGRR